MLLRLVHSMIAGMPDETRSQKLCLGFPVSGRNPGTQTVTCCLPASAVAGIWKWEQHWDLNLICYGICMILSSILTAAPNVCPYAKYL